MKTLTQEEWIQANKHDLRELYIDFLNDMELTCDNVSYFKFQDFMYAQTKHTA